MTKIDVTREEAQDIAQRNVESGNLAESVRILAHHCTLCASGKSRSNLTVSKSVNRNALSVSMQLSCDANRYVKCPLLDVVVEAQQRQIGFEYKV